MKLYRVTVYDFGAYGPRGMTHASTGLSNWAFTDKANALRKYNAKLKRARDENRRSSLRLQIITTPGSISVQPFYGGPHLELKADLVIRVPKQDGDPLLLGYRIYRLEDQLENLALAIEKQLAEETGVPVFRCSRTQAGF